MSEDWEPQFYSFPHLKSIPGPRFYEIESGTPSCNGPYEYSHRLHETDPRQDDSFRLLANGSLSFKGDLREFHKERAKLIDQHISGNKKSDINNETAEDIITEKTCSPVQTKKQDRILYPPQKYCIDQMVLDYKHLNKTSFLSNNADGIVIEFATICYHHKVRNYNVKSVLHFMGHYIDSFFL